MHRNAAAKKNIKLISTSLKGMPVPDICADFEISEGGEQILQHSVGYKPLRRKYSSASNQVKTYFPNDSCSQCPHFEHCHPKLRKYSGLIVLSHSAIGCANQQRLITAEAFNIGEEYETESKRSCPSCTTVIMSMRCRCAARSPASFFRAKILVVNFKKRLQQRRGFYLRHHDPLLP